MTDFLSWMKLDFFSSVGNVSRKSDFDVPQYVTVKYAKIFARPLFEIPMLFWHKILARQYNDFLQIFAIGIWRVTLKSKSSENS